MIDNIRLNVLTDDSVTTAGEFSMQFVKNKNQSGEQWINPAALRGDIVSALLQS